MKQDQPPPPFFNGEDSPVPLVPPGTAWQAMRERLDAQAASGKRRRGLFWLSPIGCAALLLLVIGGGTALWWLNQPTPPTVADTPSVHAPHQPLPAADSAVQPLPDEATTSLIDTVYGNAPLATEPGTLPASTTPATRRSLLATSAPRNKRIAVRNHQRTAEQSLSSLYYPEQPTPAARPLSVSTIAAMPSGTSVRIAASGYFSTAWRRETYALKALSVVAPAARTQWAAGLQTELTLPVPSPYVYFTDAKVRERFYTPFIPGAWASMTKGRHRLTLELKPFSHALLPDNLQRDSTRLGSRSLVKSFGMQAGLGYSYRIDAHWHLGASLVGSLWRKGVTSMVNYSAPPKYFNSPIRLYKDDPFKPSALGATIQVGYVTGRWEGMVQAEAPFSAGNTGKLAVWSRIGVRYRLWQSGQQSVN